MIAVVTCKKCGYINGIFIPNSQEYKQRRYCACKPEGWRRSKEHGNKLVRVNTVTTYLVDKDGKKKGDVVYS